MNGRKLLLAWCVAVSACSGSPTAPDPDSALPFRSGAYVIDMGGDSLACGDIKNPQAGTRVRVTLNMEVTSNHYVAKSTQGTLMLRFERDPAGKSISPMSLVLTGTVSGSADDEGRSLDISVPPSPLTVSSSVPLSGEIPTPNFVDFAFGTINGIVTFSRNGVSSTCPAGSVGWTLNRVP